MRNKLRQIYWLLSSQFGLDPKLLFRAIQGLPRYMRELSHFRAGYAEGTIELKPCLHDWHDEGGMIRNEYFWQDLFVARKIFEANPQRHVDIGSRVDGFVAHVAAFCEIELFDVRPITMKIPGVIFKQANLMESVDGLNGYCDSLSCLHALEHFGLGRYGDPIDPKGFEQGLVNMACLLKNNGSFYLSVPIGIDRVEFNANRIFDPRLILFLAKKNFLRLSAFTLIHQDGKIDTCMPDEKQLEHLASQRYVLGLFTFVKCVRGKE